MSGNAGKKGGSLEGSREARERESSLCMEVGEEREREREREEGAKPCLIGERH